MKVTFKPAVFINTVIMLLAVFLFANAWIEFELIASGTGTLLARYSWKWGVILLGYTLFSILILVGILLALWKSEKLSLTARSITRMRNKLGALRWILAGLILIAPVWLLQYSWLGAVLYRPYLRLAIWGVTVLALGVLLAQGEQALNRRSLLAGLVLSAAAFVISVPLQGVTDYPFSLGWSEGNRLWDYSILFGRDVYDYPADQPIPVLLDIGRQFVGGLPFLIPGLSISMARLWVALTYIFPFLALGWVAFYLPGKGQRNWQLVGLWAYTFLYQGPIHPPLVLCAVLVALAWKRPLWLAIPLIMVASYLAQLSRWTWLFAPGLWAGMLELGSAGSGNRFLKVRDWVRAISVGLAGVFGGYAAPFLITEAAKTISGVLQNWRWGGNAAEPMAGTAITSVIDTGATISRVMRGVAAQPLLWYRLLPNATYGMGILAGLLIAAGPLIIALAYFAASRTWQLNKWQKLAIGLPLFAFLVVGLTASVKIGGGGDLHNLDMFLIGLLFAGAVAWRGGGREWLEHIHTAPKTMMVMMALLIIIPAYQPLMALQPLDYSEEMGRVMTLRDDHSARVINASSPSPDVIEASLGILREEIAQAEKSGGILFMDQRQLLTFGYVQAPLITEYDKKVLINNAMGGDRGYFKQFYADLAAKRFSLIVTNPLYDEIQDSSYNFGEENNAWVTWVSKPVLCYYGTKIILKEVSIQLLEPNKDTEDCHLMIP